MTTDTVVAFVGGNSVPASEVPHLVKIVGDAYAALHSATPPPAVDPRSTFTRLRITCIDCGRTFKTIKRHLMEIHNLTPDQYRDRHRLPGDYPMTAPEYSARRTASARASGLGRK